jgi:nitrogen fixation protein NifU and related proteins
VDPEDIVSKGRLLRYFESREYRGPLPEATASASHRHPACGDEIELSLAIEAGTLQSIRFQARGCVVSQAAAAMLCEYLEGKPIAEVNAFTPHDMIALVGLPLSPRRLGCALLAYEALRLLEPFAAPPPAPPSSPSAS